MNNSTKNWIIVILFLIVLTGVFFLGYSRYPVWHPCPITKSDTIKIHDTIPHIIIDTFPYYKIHTDSIKYRDPKWMDSLITATKVDTAKLYEIFKSYYSYNYYLREWNDTLISITIDDIITENHPIDNVFTYKLLKPLQVINNSSTVNNYAKYLYLGTSFPVTDLKNTNFGLYGAMSRGFAGISYGPSQKTINVTIGFKIAKFK